MTESALAADEVRVPLGASSPGPTAAAGASPASPGVPGREEQRGSGPGVSPPESPVAERGADLSADEEQPVPYPALAATVFFCLGQTTRPRSWCLRLLLGRKGKDCTFFPGRKGTDFKRRFQNRVGSVPEAFLGCKKRLVAPQQVAFGDCLGRLREAEIHVWFLLPPP